MPPRWGGSWPGSGGRPCAASATGADSSSTKSPSARRLVLAARAVISDIEVRNELRVGLDEDATGFDFVAHERLEDLVRLEGVIHRHLEDGPCLGVHRGLPELVGIHLAETLVALDGDVGLPVAISHPPGDLVTLGHVVGVVLLLSLRDAEERR